MVSIFEDLKAKKKTVGVIGLGYVGLPVALAFAKHYKVLGFDINPDRIEMMKKGRDPSNELPGEAFENVDIEFTSDPADLSRMHFYIVAVPTPVDEHKVPDLTTVQAASVMIGKRLKPGDYVVFESTVYPGCTEEDCLPLLEAESGLRLSTDFELGYSPERINPGDKKRTVENILKIVSGNSVESCEEIAKVYGEVVSAGIYKAPSIKVAEAAKVIENAQRDLNISFVNELSMIFDRMEIETHEVLKAAGTKWNFLPFHPGLVGGHCISVDPYYLAYKAEEVGFSPQVILSGRRINDGMPAFVAKKLVQLLLDQGKSPQNCKVLVMGITFKENISDIRNSKVVDLIRELEDFSLEVHLTDPHASSAEVLQSYQLTLYEQLDNDYDAVVVAVGHDEYTSLDENYFQSIMNGIPILLDLKNLYQFSNSKMLTWRL